MKKYKEYKGLNLPEIDKEILNYWKEHRVFERSVEERDGADRFVFYEGPPSANGMPGIHHVMARTIKDLFCRYQTIKGKQVFRKAGWDTHGLPIELSVEKSLGIKKEDIGSKLSVSEYNSACRSEVMKYQNLWEDLTLKMGYWVNMNDPYITYENKYIESVWWLLAQLHKKKLLFKGYSIQPYSPAAGTGLSSHELNQPGCYRSVKDTSAVIMFKCISNWIPEFDGDCYFLAWTTTPWTLPGNTALAVGENIEYALIETLHPTEAKKILVIVAKERMHAYFNGDQVEIIENRESGKDMPYRVVKVVKGSDLKGLRYGQLLNFILPENGDAFVVVTGDFVTTEDGTGIVHIAPCFGADDYRMAQQNKLASINHVDKRGRFLPEIKDDVFLYGEEFVKEAYYSDAEKPEELNKQKVKLKSIIKDPSKLQYLSVDDRIVLKLQNEHKLFRKEKYEHNYPHCWRTDKPVLYYPLDSWFVKVSSLRDRMVELNKTINWKPESTGTGRFGNWLENANDWNLSRSRFWGIPLPVWRSEDGSEELCVSSVEQLKDECERSVSLGLMPVNPFKDFVPNDFSNSNYSSFDLHKPFADEIILCTKDGKPLYREKDLIDVWFDSGAMPYAQVHYPFENKESVDSGSVFPADFIAEGVDQTRGWFYTLHAIAVLCFDSIAYRNVVSNGLVLDKFGNKMSKRLGNAVDPFSTLSEFGADATRWYMMSNAQPWDNLKFDKEGIREVQRKFFGTLYNTWSFFAMYANVDAYSYNQAKTIPLAERSETDRWIISKLNSLSAIVQKAFDEYDPTTAARAMESFTDEHLSNWYVRLSRRRFWKESLSNMNGDKQAAYDTLYECLNGLCQLMSPIAPFFSEWLFLNLHPEDKQASVHLSVLSDVETENISTSLEENMELAQRLCSLILSIRKKENIRVRQPLQRIRLPLYDQQIRKGVDHFKSLILSEVNVKELEWVSPEEAAIVKKIKLNFKSLGKKYGSLMKGIQQMVAENEATIASEIERNGFAELVYQQEKIRLGADEVEIIPVDIPGWKVANAGNLTVALDVRMSEELENEGIARELVNRLQNLRKEMGLEITDRIRVVLHPSDRLQKAVEYNLDYICAETLAGTLLWEDLKAAQDAKDTELVEELSARLRIERLTPSNPQRV